MTTTALVVDDEVDLCRLMQITLTKMGIKSDVAYTLSQAKAYWQENDYDFCLTDLKLPDGSGLELVKHISGSSTTPTSAAPKPGDPPATSAPLVREPRTTKGASGQSLTVDPATGLDPMVTR